MQLQIDGQRYSITDKSPAIVRQRAKELIKSAEKEKADPTTIGEAIDKYIKSKERRLSPSTLTGYRKIRSKNFQGLMDLRIDQITNDDINEAVLDDELLGYSPKTIRNAHGLLSASMKKYRPTFRLNTDLPEKSPQNITIPTEQQLISLYSEAMKPEYDTQMAVVVILASWVGLRMSEILGLKFSDFQGEYVFIQRAKVASDKGVVVKSPKTVSGNRRIKISPEICQLVKSIPHDSEDDFVISLYRSTVNKRFTKICQNAGVPVCRIHDLRHFSASEALSLNIPNKYQMRRMGHKTENMLVNVYQHVMADKEDSYADIIDAHMLTLYDKALKCTRTSHEVKKI